MDWEKKHVERFWLYVEKTSGCWEWKRATARGYGLFRVGLKNLKSHRFSWLIHYGQIPDGMCVLHKCDNKLCVRPSHLFLGTFADNNKDKCAKGRQSKPKGNRNPMARLSEKQVIEIRETYSRGGITQRELAMEYGVSRQTIGAVTRKDNWGWLCQIEQA